MPRVLDEEDAKALRRDDPIPPVVARAMNYCWSNGFLDIFRRYFREHASSFIGYPTKGQMEAAEHTLEHWEIYQKYLKLYEKTLADWLDDQGIDQSDFYSEVQTVQHTTSDAKVQEFVYCLLASCDYDSFYSVMVREAKRLSEDHATKGRVVPAKAESKSDRDTYDDTNGIKEASISIDHEKGEK